MDVVNIKAYTSSETQLEALKAVMKALKIKFEVSKSIEKPYDPEFVEKILESKKQIDQGKFTEVKPQDVKAFIY